MYDDLLGPKKEKKEEGIRAPGAEKPKNRINVGSKSSCSSCGGDCKGHDDDGKEDPCKGDCDDCDDDCTPTPKDPWKDVGKSSNASSSTDPPDDCNGHCENCDDDMCKSIDAEIEELLDEGILEEDDFDAGGC